MLFHLNIRYLRENANLSQAKLGNIIGVGKTTIAGYEGGTSKPHFETLIKLCTYFKVDPTSLLYADLANGVGVSKIEFIGAAKDVQDEIARVPLYGSVSAGASGLAAFWEREQPVGYVWAKEFEGCLAAFRVVGESMEPEIKGGDIVFIRALEGGYFAPQSIYMLVTREERMIKRIRIAPDEAGVLICSSPNFAEFRLPLSEVVAVYKVAGFVRVV